MDELILYLCQLSKSLKSKEDSLEISSSEVGQLLGVSQQSASRYLVRLEGAGLIKRLRTARGQEISLTDKGAAALEGVRSDLNDLFSKGLEEKKRIIEGFLVKGIGEGAYYVREYSDEIKKKLGFVPFPGTLNVKAVGYMLDELNLDRLTCGTIKGFRKEGRTFGPIRYAPIKIKTKGLEEDCYLIVPQRTHHRDVFEIISPDNLRQKLGLTDNEKITVEF
jgi:riboflavin kinase